MLLLPPSPPIAESGAAAASWAAACSVASGLPDAFCWTKMQAESGQPLDEIVARKEAERVAGNGLFFWGIGNGLGDRVEMLLKRTSDLKVAFSVMRSRPKTEDVAPDEVMVWTAYVDRRHGIKDLPAHVLLLSRGSTAGGEKKRHYALVCRSQERLVLCPRGTIHLGRFRNLGSQTPNVGASQVTAVLEHHGGQEEGLPYDIHLLADLAEPYFVRLANPRILTSAERDAVAQISASKTGKKAWLRFVADVRSAGRPIAPDETADLFAGSRAP